MGLTSKTILITRAAHQADELKRLIEQAGGTALIFPTIEIHPPDSWDACDRAIDALDAYDGVLFTSANAVEFFTRRLRERGRSPEELKSKILCAVGERTQACVEQFGLTVMTVPETFTGVDLAIRLQQEDVRGKSFLFPRGNLAENTLPDMLRRVGATVDAIPVYRTEKPSITNIDDIRMRFLNGEIHVATFTSPSTVRNFIALFSLDDARRFQERCAFAAIGPRTAAALEQAGLRADVTAQRSTASGLVESIERYVHEAAVRNSHTAG